MQMQMECTGIDECEYAEFRFKQIFSSEWLRSPEPKGVIAVFDDQTVEYMSGQPLNEWQSTKGDAQFVFWRLVSVKKAFLPKDPNWLPDHIAALRTTWDEVLTHRAAGTMPLPPPPKVVTLDI